MPENVIKEAPKYKLLKAESTVFICNCCKRWLGRAPTFLALDGTEGEFECDCNCTSIIMRPGRPYGPKSREWKQVEEEFQELWELLPDDEDVTTDPPFRGSTQR